MTVERPGNQAETSVKLDLVLRLLAGETLTSLSRETGWHRKQLSVWRSRFLEGGQAYLEGRVDNERIATLRGAQEGLSARVAELEADNRMLARRLEVLSRSRSGLAAAHPNCSESYASACEEPGVHRLYVPEWRTHVLVREGRGGARQATGVRPYASLDPGCDVRAGLESLRQAGVVSVSLITDPMWCPDLPVLQQGFTVCRAFKESHFVDRAAGPLSYRKGHRNQINRIRPASEVREVALADHLDRWWELYERNMAERGIAQPFRLSYFERLARMPELRTVAAAMDGEIAAVTLWIRYEDILYFYDAASSDTGMVASASYAAFAHVIETATDCRYVFLGGSSGFRDDPDDGLAVFKRGFANASAMSYLCSATLGRSGAAASHGSGAATR